MIRALIIGLLASVATIAAETGARQLLILRQEHTAALPQKTTQARKTHEINVPRIKDGAVKGYAVMLLSYTVDVDALRTAAIPPTSSSSTRRSATSTTTTRSTSTISTGSISPR